MQRERERDQPMTRNNRNVGFSVNGLEFANRVYRNNRGQGQGQGRGQGQGQDQGLYYQQGQGRGRGRGYNNNNNSNDYYQRGQGQGYANSSRNRNLRFANAPPIADNPLLKTYLDKWQGNWGVIDNSHEIDVERDVSGEESFSESGNRTDVSMREVVREETDELAEDIIFGTPNTNKNNNNNNNNIGKNRGIDLIEDENIDNSSWSAQYTENLDNNRVRLIKTGIMNFSAGATGDFYTTHKEVFRYYKMTFINVTFRAEVMKGLDLDLKSYNGKFYTLVDHYTRFDDEEDALNISYEDFVNDPNTARHDLTVDTERNIVPALVLKTDYAVPILAFRPFIDTKQRNAEKVEHTGLRWMWVEERDLPPNFDENTERLEPTIQILIDCSLGFGFRKFSTTGNNLSVGVNRGRGGRRGGRGVGGRVNRNVNL